MKAQINVKMNNYAKIEAQIPLKSEPQVIYPPPKKVTAGAYIIYEIIEAQMRKSPQKKG